MRKQVGKRRAQGGGEGVETLETPQKPICLVISF